MILVTGGAGFIGANFVLGWLREPKAEGVINLDKLTYAGNLATLDSLKSDSRHVRSWFKRTRSICLDLILSQYYQFSTNV